MTITITHRDGFNHKGLERLSELLTKEGFTVELNMTHSASTSDSEIKQLSVEVTEDDMLVFGEYLDEIRYD